MLAVDSPQPLPILLLDIIGFSLGDKDNKRAALKRLQGVLTQTARHFLPGEVDIWSTWLRHDVGDGYYVVPATLTPRGGLAYAMRVRDELERSQNDGGPDLRLRMTLAYGKVERVDDQILSEAFIVARRFIEDEAFKIYAGERAKPAVLVMSERYHQELEDDPTTSARYSSLEDQLFSPVEVQDKHGMVHRGFVLGPGWVTSPNPVPKLSRPLNTFVGGVFDTLVGCPILILLAQIEHDLGELIAAILDQARTRWGESNTLYVTPPYSSETDSERYFARLGRQCGFVDEIRDAADWDDALDQRLSEGTQVFLLIHGLDHGPDKDRRQLAGTLRSLIERHRSQLRVVLAGSEKLAALRYEQGELSLLDFGEVLALPELESADVLDWQQRDYPGCTLDEAQATRLLGVCGGHPRLLRFLLHRWNTKGEMSRDACVQALRDYSYVKQLFQQFSRDPNTQRQICEWLQQKDLGEFRFWPLDPLVRRLYWSDFLSVTKEERFKWRCEVLREVGRLELKCDPKPGQS